MQFPSSIHASRPNKSTVLLCVLGMIFVLASYGAAEYLYEKDLTFRAAETNAVNQVVLHSALESLRAIIVDADHLLQNLKVEQESSGNIQGYGQALIWSSMKNHPFVQIAVSNRQGDLIYSAVPLSQPINISDREHFRAHIANDSARLYIAPPRIAQATGSSAIFLSRRLNRADGSFNGIVSVGISPQYITNLFKKLQLGPANTLVLLRTDGIMLARHPATLTAEQADTFRHHPVIKQLNQGILGGNYQSPGAGDGKARLGAFEALADYPVLAIISTTIEAAFQKVFDRRIIYIGWASAFSGLALISLFTVWTRLRRQRVADQKLRDKEELYRTLLDQSYDAIALIDPVTNEILECNHRFSEILGYKLPDDSPLCIDSITHASKENARQNINTLIQTGTLAPAVCPIRAKDGRLLFMERAGSLIKIRERTYLLDILRDVTEKLRSHEAWEHDAAFARRVQQLFLPKNLSRPSVQVETMFHPFRYVSGDIYYAEWLKENRLLRGYLVDVTGHGMATALQTAAVTVLLHEVTDLRLPLKDTLLWLNQKSAQYFEESAFAAALAFDLDLDNRQLNYCGAGITEFRFNGTRIEVPGIFLGVMASPDFDEVRMPIAPDDVICFMTDGLTDMLAEKNLDPSCYNSCESIIEASHALIDAGLIRDDATALCLKILK